MKKLGIIGGLGPLATAYFYKLITDFTMIKKEQEHIEIIIHSRPSIPDRTASILSPQTCPSPLPAIIETGRELAGLGCEVIAIPCVTAHCFYDRYSQQIPAEMINMPLETAAELHSYGVSCAGIMATDGTVKTGVLEKSLAHYGIKACLPSSEKQAKTMSIIYDQVKLGLPIDYSYFEEISSELYSNGAEVVILGCTELSLARRHLEGKYIDVLDVLAKRSVTMCGAQTKPEYEHLV